MKPYQYLIAALACCSVATSGALSAQIDPSLQRALDENPNERVPALVMFERQAAELPAAGAQATRARAQALSDADARETQRILGRRGEAFWVVNAQRIALNRAEMGRLVASGRVRAISNPDAPIITTDATKAPRGRGRNALTQSTWGQSRIGAPAAYARGLTGAGVRVGVIDSGITPNHPLISGRVVAWGDFVNGLPAPYDDQGHGTLVSGVIAGRANTTSGQLGVAPNVDLVVAKAISGKGYGEGDMFLRAAQWIVDPDGNPATADHPTIINNSWSSSAQQHPWMKTAIQTWRAMGILPVFAAGNAGPGEGTIGSPSDYEEVLTVGATNRTGNVASFSSRGPVMWVDDPNNPGATRPIPKPDLVAPGEEILTTHTSGLVEYADGTSLAAPMVAGAAALMTQMHPGITPEHLMQNLFASLAPVPGGPNAAGRGELRIPASIAPAPAPAPAPPGHLPNDAGATPPALTPPSVSLGRALPRYTRAKWLNMRLLMPDDAPILYRYVVNGKSRGSIESEPVAPLVFPGEGRMNIAVRVMDITETALGRVPLGTVIVDRTAPVLRPKLTRQGRKLRLRVGVVERVSGLAARPTVQIAGKRPRVLRRTIVFPRPSRTVRVVLRATDRAGNRTKIVGRVSPAGELRILTPKRTSRVAAARQGASRRG